MTHNQPHPEARLTDQVGLTAGLQKEARRADDRAWIEVIQRMDDIYADLVHYQVELEEKNSQLEDAQRFIQSVISSMSEILIVCDINGHIQRVNQALLDNIDIAESQITGKPLSMLFGEKHLAMVADFPEHIRSGALIDCEVDLVNSRQQLVPMALNCSVRFDYDDRPSGMVITGRPLGELRKAYDELHLTHEELKTAQKHLIQSEKMATLGRLVAGVAHELNNPISFLFGNMHALNGYQDKLKAYLDAIHNNVSKKQRETMRETLRIDYMLNDIPPLVEASMEGAERISEIVQNLRIFSTPQESKKQPFDLVSVLKRATMWALKAATINPEISEHYPAQLTLINNEGYIHQVLINLIQNAIDAMQQIERPKLEIILKQDEKSVNIHIHDNGHGIVEADLLKVFDPFFTTKAVGSGTGLGLYISYGLATEQCQGNLSVQNHIDGGAEFIFSLPLEAKA
ncbi:MAG: GHKL domain-containing protein [Gammaproteobacteria bacterium]|nr:GHKL domain-containing protein [Gammaproteobacteria bacterium]